MASRIQRGVPLSTLCPKFLHTNSTSHTWPFSAIAELIDNAYDPDVSAKQFWIDKTVVGEQECLIFMDNGNGLDRKAMHKMLSFGYSDKVPVNGHRPIGMYGNGFKSGSMRLGKDTIVFSKSKNSLCVGMLSQTYLERIHADQIIVPIVCFEKEETNELTVKEEHKTSLQDILHYSPFKTREELLTEIEAITSTWSTEKTGTRIIIWNLRSTSTRTTEFDFETDRYDIRIPSDVYEAMNDTLQQTGDSSHIPQSLYSLRAYCSILYLKPRMQIIIRGQKVRSELIAKSLAYIRRDYYRPFFLPKRVPIIFGYNTKSKEQYGVMMYHKNRLIKAYERLGCQLRANNKGVGVIGIIECNFLDPTHNKQSFIETDKYRKTMINLGIKLEEYWHEIRHKRSKENPNSMPVEDTMTQPDQNWVQCDNLKCLKWRKLPDGIDCSNLPDKWFCHMNPDPQFRNCQVNEEDVDSDDDTRSCYRKTYKHQERETKIQEIKKVKAEDEQMCLSEQHDLNGQNQPALSSSTPTTPRTSIKTESSEGGAAVAELFTVSQAACSPSSSNGIPVISGVFSLSEDIGLKRAHSTTQQGHSKRSRMNGLHQASSAPSTPVNVSTLSISSEDTDDSDYEILESVSTPKPPKSDTSLAKVKAQQVQRDVVKNLEHRKDPPLDVAMDTSVSRPAPAPAPAPAPVPVPVPVPVETNALPATLETTNRGCQTDISKVKREGKAEHSGATQILGKSFSNKQTSVVEVEDEQILELMQAIAQERDSLKEQVRALTCQLHDMQRKLQKLSQISVKKECCHRSTQTEKMEDGEDKQTHKKAKKLMKDKLLPGDVQTTSSAAHSEEKGIDQVALKVKGLDERNEEKEKLHLQTESVSSPHAGMSSPMDTHPPHSPVNSTDECAPPAKTLSGVNASPGSCIGTGSRHKARRWPVSPFTGYSHKLIIPPPSPDKQFVLLVGDFHLRAIADGFTQMPESPFSFGILSTPKAFTSELQTEVLHATVPHAPQAVCLLAPTNTLSTNRTLNDSGADLADLITAIHKRWPNVFMVDFPPRIAGDLQQQELLRQEYRRVAAEKDVKYYFSAVEHFPLNKLELWTRNGIYLSDCDGMKVLAHLLWSAAMEHLQTSSPVPSPAVRTHSTKLDVRDGTGSKTSQPRQYRSSSRGRMALQQEECFSPLNPTWFSNTTLDAMGSHAMRLEQ